VTKSFGESFPALEKVALLTGTEGEKSLLAGKCCAFKRDQGKMSEKKLSLLAERLSLEKKVCAFEWCLVLSQEYTKSFGGKNLPLCKRIFPIKSQSICLISD